MSFAELLDGGEVPDDVVLVLVLARPQNDEAVLLAVDRDGELELPQSVHQRLQELGQGLGGDRQEDEHQADRQDLGKTEEQKKLP